MLLFCFLSTTSTEASTASTEASTASTEASTASTEASTTSTEASTASTEASTASTSLCLEKCPPFDQNTYILKINVVLDLMINTHLGSILRVQISMSLSLAPTFSYHSRRKTITSCSATWVLFLHLGRWLRSLQVVAAVGVSCYLLWEQSKTGWSEDMRGACCPRRAWTIGPGRDPDQPDLSCSIGPESA